jgi:hypothetical protein
VQLLRRNRIRNPATVMFRRAAVERAGGFRSGVDACADYDLYLRISRTHPVVFHEHVVADYRKHANNMSNNAALMLRQLRRVMRRHSSCLVDPAHHQALREGMQNIRSYYGDRVMSQLRARVRTGRGWTRTLEDVATLAWCHPGGLVEHLRRKLAVTWGKRDTNERRPSD